MRGDWRRPDSALTLSSVELTVLMQPAFRGQTVVEAEPAAGGLANTNIRVMLSGQPAPLLVRLYQRDGAQVGKDVALNRLMQGRVPVPRFHVFAETNPVNGHPYVVMDWVDGTRLETVGPRLDGAALDHLARAVGAALVPIHGVVFERMGMLDAELNVVEPFTPGHAGFVEFLRACLIDGPGAARLGAALTRRLMDFADEAGTALDAWDGPPCLAHGDFGGSNILVREAAEGWTVAAVLDWEFAVAATPFLDFGNLLRPPVGSLPGFAAAVANGYTQAGGRLPAEWRRLSRLTDLLAWAEFLSRTQAGPALIDDARAVIAATIGGSDIDGRDAEGG